MKFIPINHKNIEHLTQFIENIGASSKFFRYYDKRQASSVINNHIVTLLLFDGPSVGYGHLDKEKDKIWLGICVKEGFEGKGYGKKIMKKLINSYDKDIHLSVDKDNKKAFHLYKRFSFKKIKESDTMFFMKRTGVE